jgi:glycosyltransferase involved in cell wall biosynthesis
MDGVQVCRYRYAPACFETLVNDGGIAANLKRQPWKWLLVPGFLLMQLLAAWRLARNRPPDVIHAHWLLPQGLIACRLTQIASIPYLATSHGGDLFGLRSCLPTALKRRVAAACAAMTVVSRAMRDEANRLGLAPPRLDVLPMGVDLRDRFLPDPAQVRRVDELLFVGRLVPKKGLCHLLDALPAVLEKRPSVVLTIAGFGPEENALKAQAQRLGIERSVNFVGAMPQHELPALYRRAALFVAPFVRDSSGDQEGLPVVLMEAIGCGCPVIVGDVAGIHDLLGDAARDVCVAPQNTETLAAAILAILDNPSDARIRAQAIRQAVADHVDWQVIAQRYADLLKSCIAAR